MENKQELNQTELYSTELNWTEQHKQINKNWTELNWTEEHKKMADQLYNNG